MHLCPTFALHASLWLLAHSQALPFQGIWPEIRWPQSCSKALLGVIACRVLPEEARAGLSHLTAHLAFSNCDRSMCLPGLAKKANMCEVPGEPAFLQGATWLCSNKRWQIRLKSPPNDEQLPGLMERVVHSFQGTGSEHEVQQRSREMHALLKGSRASRNLPWHYVNRLLCWAEFGPPAREGKPAMGLLLHGTEGHNFLCHGGCLVEKPGCLSIKHMRWGRPKDNGAQRVKSSKAKAARSIDNLKRT